MNEIQKAIELLKVINRNMKVEHISKDMMGGVTTEEIKEYREDFRLINVTISALEKQIPKKPLQSNKCPSCREMSIKDEYGTMNSCCQCGQAIDWEIAYEQR